MNTNHPLLKTGKAAFLCAALGTVAPQLASATGADALLCDNLTEEECRLSMQDKQPLSPVPALFKFQARVAQAKMPLPNAEFEQVFVKVLQGASDVLCVEQFRKVQVRDSVLNLEIGRNISCDLGPTIAQNNDLQIQVCLGSEGNCLKPISLGTTPYAIQSSYSEWSQNTAHADVSTQSHYAHRITADRNLLVTGVSDPNVGYFDFFTSSDDSKYADLLYMGNEYPSATRHGFMQWTPLSSEGNSLHVVSKSADGQEKLGPLDRFYVYGLDTVFSHDATVNMELNVKRNAKIATTLEVGQTITVPGDGNERTGTGTINAETVLLNGPGNRGYLFVNGGGYAGANGASGLFYDGELRVEGNGQGIAAGSGSASDALGTNDKLGRISADSLSIAGDGRINRDALVGRNLTVGGDATVTGNATVSQNLITGGSSTTAGNQTTQGNTEINGRLNVAHAAGESDSYIKELKVTNLTVLSSFTQGGGTNEAGFASSENMSVNDYINAGGDVKVGDASGGAGTKIHLHAGSGSVDMAGDLSVTGNAVVNDLQVNGTFTMPGAVGWDNGVRAGGVMVGDNGSTEIKPVSSAQDLILRADGWKSVNLQTGDYVHTSVGVFGVLHRSQALWWELDGDGNWSDGRGKTYDSKVTISPWTSEINVGSNITNVNCAGCDSSAGGDPRSVGDPVGRITADAVKTFGDVSVGRNLSAGDVTASTVNATSVSTTNLDAGGGLRGNGVVVGRAPDYSVNYPYEMIATKSTGHNLRLSSARSIVFQKENAVHMQLNENGVADFYKGVHIKGLLPAPVPYEAPYSLTTTSGNSAVSCFFGLCWPSVLLPGLRVDGFIMAGGLLVVSDERVKDVIGISDSSEDLETLRSIEITDYVHKDVRNQGKGLQKKVIAQQVEEVFPQAVSLGQDFIPDVYRNSEEVVFDADEQSLTVFLNGHELEKDDRIKVVVAAEEHEVTVADVPGEDEFVVEHWPAGKVDEVFVYGRFIDDMRTVDYDAIAMLNVSATQELAGKLDAAQEEIRDLKTQNQVLENRLAKVEAMLAKIDTKEAVTHAKPQAKSRGWLQTILFWWRS